MKQNMKRILLVLCMAVCFMSMTACGSKNDMAEEPIPQEVVDAMKSGAQNYLMQFDSFDDERIASELKRVEKQKNDVMISALTAWKSVRVDLGKMADSQEAIESQEITRVGDSGYRLTAVVIYEKKKMDFTLSVKEVMDDYGGSMLQPTELVFSPQYTTVEKLSKAGKNTLLGMGTVFIVLIFISYIISMLKGVNAWEARRTEKNDGKGGEAPTPAVAVTPAPVSASQAIPAPLQTVEAPALTPELYAVITAAIYESENLADDKELVAVITAAIAAAQCVPADGLIVRSIRRRSGSKWKNA